MSNSIYNPSAWVANTAYVTHDIVIQTAQAYYAKVNHTDASFTLSRWGGRITDNGEDKPHFIWIPSYDFSVSNQPRVASVRFGDGYEQRMQDGINNHLLTLNFAFEQRKLAETTAILHFLTERKGTESFVFTPLPPRAKAKRFVCREWEDSQQFYENYSVRATFQEVVT